MAWPRSGVLRKSLVLVECKRLLKGEKELQAAADQAHSYALGAVLVPHQATFALWLSRIALVGILSRLAALARLIFQRVEEAVRALIWDAPSAQLCIAGDHCLHT